MQSNESSSSAVRFGGGLAGTAGSTAPRSAVLLAQMRSRQAAIHAAASSAARNDPEVRAEPGSPICVIYDAGLRKPDITACKSHRNAMQMKFEMARNGRQMERRDAHPPHRLANRQICR